ncbi:thermonuclease family protein [Cereibacter sphaeroides]|uniref:thermonuclease family protein n=1 Tax=Cereibacter sphaeroides TaxID=1063 RepID=UPI001F3CACA4|nr:thermonuclease family protein [Cereibacter sphaeroides]MCE6959230.1 thermonuclease family protein [Cereibacter sphaeroides]MCE6972033.1 thermonuclease family protein [Cereibacter sphaeroides]
MLRTIIRILAFLFGPKQVLTITDPLVIDGDTIWHAGKKYRLHGIDAPELSQPGGEEAKRMLFSLVNGRTLAVKVVDTDAYGRMVARLHCGRQDISAALVASGHALARHDLYRNDERRARKCKTGLWSRGGISDPAEWRRRAA